MRVVIPSVHYADFLTVILPAWLRVVALDELTVVTSPDDMETQAVAKTVGVGLLVTDAWSRDDAIFNKAAALDEAFGITPRYREAPAVGELCLSLDCDVYPFGRFPSEQEIKRETIYGCARYRCPSASALRSHVRGLSRRASLDLIPPKVKGQSYTTITNTRNNAVETATKALGYFQLFRWRPGLAFGSSRTAGKYDLDFRDQFARRRGLWPFYVLHLGDQDRANWKGRVIPRWPAQRPRPALGDEFTAVGKAIVDAVNHLSDTLETAGQVIQREDESHG
jgi:hypothetical protein